MKKISALFSICILLSGCSLNIKTISVDNPYEVLANGETISYYDTININNVDCFEISHDTTDMIGAVDKPNTIIVNDEGEIRLFLITDNRVATYKNISVGDSVSKIEDAFSYEETTGNIYTVLFNGIDEQNPTIYDKEDSWIWIDYITDGEKIECIEISDVKFGKYLY
jgi:uncharacterized protein YceK